MKGKGSFAGLLFPLGKELLNNMLRFLRASLMISSSKLPHNTPS
jgi:hypothetical protein